MTGQIAKTHKRGNLPMVRIARSPLRKNVWLGCLRADISQMDSDSTLAVDAEGTPIGSANQEVSLPNSLGDASAAILRFACVHPMAPRPDISTLFPERHQTTRFLGNVPKGGTLACVGHIDAMS
jgi:hypothetical protein